MVPDEYREHFLEKSLLVKWEKETNRKLTARPDFRVTPMITK